jgi:hypothetical protein
MHPRLRVVGIGLLIGGALSVLLGLIVVGRNGGPSLEISNLLLLCGPAGGPLSEPLANVDYSLPRMASE